MNCRTVRSLLMTYLDSELDVRSSLEVGEHLERCDACRARFEAEARLERLVARHLGVEAMPEDVWRRLRDGAGAAASRSHAGGRPPAGEPPAVREGAVVARRAAAVSAQRRQPRQRALPRAVNKVLAMLAVLGALCALPASGIAQPVYWAGGEGLVSSPTGPLLQQVQALAQAGQASGLDISVSTEGGVTYLNGMPIWSLGAGIGSTYDAIASSSPPGHVAINLSSITWGDVGENDPNDIAQLFVIALHEAAHAAFGLNLQSVCEGDIVTWATVYQCHLENGGHACNEWYAHSSAARALCDSLEDISDPNVRGAAEGELGEQLSECCGHETGCAEANEACGPPEMPMPQDHGPCENCDGTGACEEDEG